MTRETVRMSVRAVVETTLHESDLSPASGAAKRMREGAAAHVARQKDGGVLERAYQKEVALSADYEGKALLLHVTGRADGIFMREDGLYVIEEIKLGSEGLPLIPAHRAQAVMYAHMLCQREELERAGVRVLYVNIDGQRLAQHEEILTREALAQEFSALCAPAAAWEEKKLLRRQARNASLLRLAFPYAEYRAGQRKFAANAYVAIRERRRLFAQAPTGIGKTMAALYPSLRAMGEGKCARAVFLAARTTGRRAALDAMDTLTRSGAKALTVEIAAKDKACPMPVRDCRPEVCPLAKGFYDRLPAALEEALRAAENGASLNRESVAALGEKHRLCPFELSLAIAQLGDVVVCDYNYVYDPLVALDALLAAPGGACLLVDEAHQLAPRVRDAYSCVLEIDALREIRRDIGKMHGRSCALYRVMTGAIRAMKETAEQGAFEHLNAPPQAVSRAMERVRETAGEMLAAGGGKSALDAFSLAMGYLFAAERFDERYALITSGGEKHARIELALLNAAPEILAAGRRARGVVYFSATLAPFDAAKKMLGSEEGDACLALPSPFDPMQIAARIVPIDIRYASREATAPQAAQEIGAFLKANAGHTIVFFPSYAYLARIGELLMGQDGHEDTIFLRERRGMAEDEKNALLGAFKSEEDGRICLLAVLGGAFSEGIDLPGKQLENVAIVSTGLPQPDARVRAMQAYYDGIGENGFDLAMTLPGMVRVIQAAGRLIRTESDRGALLLIDSRYRSARVRALLRGTLIGDALGIE